MADPLLTSLCSICHVSPPKYKCPRCNIQTCSLPCTKKHKAWSECSGQRDPTSYVRKSKLHTAAGVDHDYNFLHGIELSVERNEKLLVEDKGIVAREELRPLTMQQVRWKTGRDGRKRKVLVTQVLREAKGRVFEKFLAQRLKKLNVQILCAPLGMARQRENNTTFNRRTGRVNWQVEWFSFPDGTAGGDAGKSKPVRTLSKVMDDVPLFQAYPAMVGEKTRQETGEKGKHVRSVRTGECQSAIDSRWNYVADSIQDPLDCRWVSCSGANLEIWPAAKEKAQRDAFQFFLSGQQTRSDMPSLVTVLDSGECLRDILANTKVLEFPSIYVLQASQSLPDGFEQGPKDTILPPNAGTKRKGGPEAGGKNEQHRQQKRRRGDGKDFEDGEVGGGDDVGAADEDDGSKGPVGLEAGEVIAEQSLGEEDDYDEDDETSSSGSDGDSE